jgi:hypothetical protein
MMMTTTIPMIHHRARRRDRGERAVGRSLGIRTGASLTSAAEQSRSRA